MDGSSLSREAGEIDRLYPALDHAAAAIKRLDILTSLCSRPALRPGSAEHRIVSLVREMCDDILKRSE